MAQIITDQSGNPYALTYNSADSSLNIQPAPGLSPSTGDNSIFFTALDMITSALRLINVYAPGEQLTTAEANDGLLVFNQMIDAWNADRLAIFSIRADDYPFVLGQQAYTYGPGGNLNTNRPARIESMSAILLNNPTNPIEVPITQYTFEDWQRMIPVKNVTSSFPQVYYDDGGFPLRTLNFWPIPNALNNLRVYSWQPLGAQSGLATMINLPPGYAEAFRFNLALRLGPEFGAQVPPLVAQLAAESLARVKAMNAPQLELRSDLLSTEPGYNYRQDMFGIAY